MPPFKQQQQHLNNYSTAKTTTTSLKQLQHH